MVTVRRATTSDLDWLMVQLRAFSEFFRSSRELFGDENHARITMQGLIENHVVFIAERDDGIRMGFVGGILVPHFMNPTIRTLSELFWWVDPLHRHSRAALLLLEAFTEHGKLHADWITFSLEDHSPVSDRCLTRRGFKPKEQSYLLEVG